MPAALPLLASHRASTGEAAPMRTRVTRHASLGGGARARARRRRTDQERQQRVDLTRSASRRRTTGFCAQRTAGVDVRLVGVGSRLWRSQLGESGRSTTTQWMMTMSVAADIRVLREADIHPSKSRSGAKSRVAGRSFEPASDPKGMARRDGCGLQGRLNSASFNWFRRPSSDCPPRNQSENTTAAGGT